MNISGINPSHLTGSQVGTQGEDAAVKNIKNQIAQVQKKLQELASNGEISVEEKMKKRGELQKKLTELNTQLRQCQMEQQKKAEEAKKKQQEQNMPVQKQGQEQTDPAAEFVLSADAAMKQARAQDGVVKKMEGRAGVLEAEIKLDSGRNRSVEKKQEELSDIENNTAKVRGSQMDTLNQVNQEAKKAGKKQISDKDQEEQEEEKEEKEKEKLAEYKEINLLL